eukprot:TRINITY_DN6943_c0_g1_i1.p1 TRINITY_DN6943_c0_g1~~TRINITY_DN6943_c0_g1_i1.p1  ORF type:complete len:402 (+),score=90.45 TRINITY_DN6943_c0_g1_i1:1108-2313(+)
MNKRTKRTAAAAASSAAIIASDNADSTTTIQFPAKKKVAACHMEIPLLRVGVDVTEELWCDFPKFIGFIEQEFKHIGAVRVRPPEHWAWHKPDEQSFVAAGVLKTHEVPLDTLVRQTTRGNRGVYEVFTEFTECDKSFTVAKYECKVRKKSDRDVNSISSMLDLERSFFQNIQRSKPFYGVRTVGGTLFGDSEIPWNLNRIDSPLNLIAGNIPGVTAPYLYFGNFKSFFPWHVEDLDLLSVNYIHFGAPKRWYVVPPAHFDNFKKRAELLAKQFKVPTTCPEFLRHKGFMAEPHAILNPGEYAAGFHLAGEFMIVFARAFHAGFNCGWNCAESVNFGSETWKSMLPTVSQCHCSAESVTIDVGFAMKLLNGEEGDEGDEQQIENAIAEQSTMPERCELNVN